MKIDILKECSGAKVIGITGHVRPDGDCTGSSMALYLYLKQQLPEVNVYVYLEEEAKNYTHIPCIEEIDSSYQEQAEYDLFFILDTVPERCGEAKKLYDLAKKTINIDHHITNPGDCSDVNVLDASIGSTAEIMYQLLPKEAITSEIAKAIYIGMIHDTGVFQYSNTLPSTLCAAADLISKEIDFPNLIQESFYERSYKQLQVLSEVINQSKRYLENSCIVSVLSREYRLAHDLQSSDFSGMINQLKNVTGIHCAVFMYELEPDTYKVSLRTSEKVDATQIVTLFGGGGHKRAAGVTMDGNAETITKLVLDEIAKQL